MYELANMGAELEATQTSSGNGDGKFCLVHGANSAHKSSNLDNQREDSKQSVGHTQNECHAKAIGWYRNQEKRRPTLPFVMSATEWPLCTGV